MKKYILTLLICATAGLSAQYQQMVVGIAEDPKTAKSIQQRTIGLIEKNKTLSQLYHQHKLYVLQKQLKEQQLVVVTPVTSEKLKDTLNFLFRPLFQDAFFVKEWDAVEAEPLGREEKANTAPKELPSLVSAVHLPQVGNEKKEVIRKKSLISGLDNEWLALIVLAALGIILVLRSAYQIKKIQRLQHALEETQKNNSTYLQKMGEKYV